MTSKLDMQDSIIDEMEEAELERCGYPPTTDVLQMMEQAAGRRCSVDRMLALIDTIEEGTAVAFFGARARGKCYRLVS